MNLIQHQERMCNELVSRGWTVLDDFFEPDLIAELNAECRLQQQLGLMRQAGTGRAGQFAVQQLLRADQIRWLEPGMSPAVDRYLVHIETLRACFNRHLYLGLQECESHFAFYPPGAFYQKHVDRFSHEDSRVISAVLYLNPEWEADHSGALRLHLEKSTEDIAPVSNRFVLFISAQVLHEVIATNADRLSLTGWFKRGANNGRQG